MALVWLGARNVNVVRATDQWLCMQVTCLAGLLAVSSSSVAVYLQGSLGVANAQGNCAAVWAPFGFAQLSKLSLDTARC